MRTALWPLAGLALALSPLPPARAAAPPLRAGGHVDALGDPLPAEALARLGTARFRAGAGRFLALSPTGRTLAVLQPASQGEMITLLDARTGKLVRPLDRAPPDPSSLRFSEDGRHLIVATRSGDIYLWEVDSPKPGRVIRAGRERGSAFALSHDGKVYALGYQGVERPRGPLLVHDFASGRELASLAPLHPGNVSVTLSSDGKLLASWGSERFGRGPRGGPGGPGGAGGPGGGRAPRTPRGEATRTARTVQVWDVEESEELWQVQTERDAVVSVSIAPGGKLLAGGTSTGAVWLWDLQTGKHVRTLEGLTRSASYLRFSPDGTVLLAADLATVPTLAAWEVGTGKVLPTVVPPPCRLQQVAFAGKDRVIACGLSEQSVVVWDVFHGDRLDFDLGHQGAISSLAFSPDGSRVYSASPDRRILEWDRAGNMLASRSLAREAPRGRFGRPSADVFTLSPGGAYLVSQTARSWTISVRERASGKEVWSVRSDGSFTVPPGFSPDGALLAVSCVDASTTSTAEFVKLPAGEKLEPFARGGAAVVGVAPGPGGKVAVAIQQESTTGEPVCNVHLWNPAARAEDLRFHPYRVPGEQPTALLSFSPDGRLLAVTSPAGVTALLDGETGAELGQLTSRGAVSAVTFSPDGRTLAIASNDPDGESGLVALWEVSTGKVRWQVPRGLSAVTALAFSPDGCVLATGHLDTTALLWDVAGRRRKERPLAARRWDEVWSELGGDAAAAHGAQKALVTAGREGVAFLGKKLRPAEGKVLEEKALATLAADLDADEFAARQKAESALAEQGRAAAGVLRKVAAEGSAEARKRARRLLRRIESKSVPAEMVRPLRVLEVLERLGTPEATALLEKLAAGQPGADLTREAKASLARVKGRPR